MAVSGQVRQLEREDIGVGASTHRTGCENHRVTRIRLHGAYREMAEGAREVRVPSGTVADALSALVRAHPTLGERLRDEHGRLREHLSLFVNGCDTRGLSGELTEMEDTDTLDLIPALSGGSA